LALVSKPASNVWPVQNRLDLDVAVTEPPFGVAFFIDKMKRVLPEIFLLALFLLSSACTSYAPRHDLIGQHRDVLIAQMGQPEREYPWQEFQKLHYPRGPAGWHTYFIYLDKNNRIARWEQVLTEDRFDGLVAGMTRDQVIDTIGISRIKNQLANNQGYIWYYRYQTTQCRSFVIEFNKENIVRGTIYIHRSGRKCQHVGP